MLNGYEAIRNKPFQPHAVARTRPLAYQYSVVMKYLDNLIAWGDNLFQQDTSSPSTRRPSSTCWRPTSWGAPAADSALGTVRGQDLRPAEGAGPRTRSATRSSSWRANSRSISSRPDSAARAAAQTSALFGIGRTLYFCIPRNDKLLGYWDTVADRLFKIRHCMNIAGVVRPLALFDPPIDPGMLVKAAAAGIDIGSIVSGRTSRSALSAAWC